MRIIFFIFFLFSFIGLKAQDKLYLKNGDTLNVEITNRSNKEIKYIINDSSSDLTSMESYTIKLFEIDRIVYSDKREEKIVSVDKKTRQKKIIKNRFIFTPGTKFAFHKGGDKNLKESLLNLNLRSVEWGLSYERLIGKSINKKGLEISYLFLRGADLNSFDIAFKFYSKDKNKKKDKNRNKITSNYYYGPLIGLGFERNYKSTPNFDLHSFPFGGKFGYSLRKGVFGANFELRFIKLNDGHFFVDFGVMPILNF